MAKKAKKPRKFGEKPKARAPRIGKFAERKRSRGSYRPGSAPIPD